jgi:hypothetical protein
MIESIIARAPAEFEPTDEGHIEKLYAAADEILDGYPDRDALESLELQLIEAGDEVPVFVHVATKLARSKQITRGIEASVHVSVVFALYLENERILRPEEHQHGEDFLIRKIAQLDWLFGGTPNFSWDMYVVDDGCPENSGLIAQEILDRRYGGDSVHVLFLEDAIRNDSPATRPMTSTRDSQKGGSVAYGMWTAAQQEHDNHIILYTDADLSTHLGQIGLLVEGIVSEGQVAAIGSRREPTSVVVKTGLRNTRGKLFIYLWKRLLPLLGEIVDTQCGFKAFRGDLSPGLVDDLMEKRFAFDIELLIRLEQDSPGRISKVPIAWIDSEAASTTTAARPYLPMLKSIVKMYRRYLDEDPGAETYAGFIEGLDDLRWSALLERIPAQIADADPASFGDFDEISAQDLETLLD